MATDICVRFGLRLQNLRRENGLKQIYLAVRTGISRIHISRLENGWTEPGLRTLEALAMGLGVKPWSLIKGI
jgi:transcriptional regulator with XRE-family HTH domain